MQSFRLQMYAFSKWHFLEEVVVLKNKKKQKSACSVLAEMECVQHDELKAFL